MSLRTASLGRSLDALAQGRGDGAPVRNYLVRELSEEELIAVVLQPTALAPLPGSEEVPQEKYRLQFEQGLAESIAREALRTGGPNQESSLVLVHAVCARLWQAVRGRGGKVARADDLQAARGV